MMPLEFGGDDIPQNTLYVPLGIASVKSQIDTDIISPLIEKGTVTQYSAEPEYQGNSFIPIRLRVKAFNPGNYAAEINIWGEALKERR